MAWNVLPDDLQCLQFQEGAKDASVSECTWTLSALEALRNALYKFKTYLLTLLTDHLRLFPTVACTVPTVALMISPCIHQVTFVFGACDNVAEDE